MGCGHTERKEGRVMRRSDEKGGQEEEKEDEERREGGWGEAKTSEEERKGKERADKGDKEMRRKANTHPCVLSYTGWRRGEEKGKETKETNVK